MKYDTPPAWAKVIGVAPKKITAAISRGELKASNLSEGSRPRWHIAQADLEAWLEARSNFAIHAEKPIRREIQRPIKRYV